MKKVLVTGSNGMLGQDLCPILEQNGYDVVKTDRKSLDITDKTMVYDVLTRQKPDIVIHCAAYTNVDKAEEDLLLATKINVKGTDNFAKFCGENNIILVYISTDYVFDGEKGGVYYSNDSANPLNNYGLTKYQGEEVVRKYCSKYYIARTAWLYGIYGKNFVETMISLSTKPELKVVNDQTGCPTWTVELCRGIIKLLQGKKFGTYHVCGGGETSWYGFAREIFKQMGLSVNLKPCTTDEFPRPAKRPRYSVMNNDGLCRDWKEGLSDYIKLRNGGCK